MTRGLRPGRILSIAQLALSLLLLVGAGLFVRSLQNLNGNATDAFRQSVLILRVEPRGSDQRNIPGTTERLDRTYRELIRRAQEIPTVRLASMANGTPTAPTSTAGAGVRMASGENVASAAPDGVSELLRHDWNPDSAGRDFGTGDLIEHAPAVCIVNESFARQVFPGENPLGKPCYTGRRARLLSAAEGSPAPSEPFTIVGVVQDSRYSNPRGEMRPLIYMTFLQTNTGRGQMVLHVRTSGQAWRGHSADPRAGRGDRSDHADVRRSHP